MELGGQCYIPLWPAVATMVIISTFISADLFIINSTYDLSLELLFFSRGCNWYGLGQTLAQTLSLSFL